MKTVRNMVLVIGGALVSGGILAFAVASTTGRASADVVDDARAISAILEDGRVDSEEAPQLQALLTSLIDALTADPDALSVLSTDDRATIDEALDLIGQLAGALEQSGITVPPPVQQQTTESEETPEADETRTRTRIR